jgi:hypothetical protein
MFRVKVLVPERSRDPLHCTRARVLRARQELTMKKLIILTLFAFALAAGGVAVV